MSAFEIIPKAFLRAQELVRIVSKLGPRKQHFISVHELQETSDSQEAQLYRTILHTKDAGERAVLKNLPETFNRKRFSVIQSELIDDLYRLVFVLDLKQAKYSEYAQRLNELRKAVFLATTLSAMGSSLLATDLAEKFIEEARELEEWLPALEFLHILREYASRKGKYQEFDSYSAEYMNTLDRIQALEKAETVRERIVSNFARSGSEKPWLKEETDKALAELRPAIEKHKTFKLRWLALRLRQYGNQLIWNYPEALQIADESDALLNEYPQFDNRARRATIAHSRLTCLLQTLQFDEAKAVIEQLETLETPGESNWYYFKEWHFLHRMRTEQFEQARNLCQSVIKSKAYPAQSEPLQHKFRLFEIWADYYTGRPMPMAQKRKGERTGEITKNLLQLFPTLKEDEAGFKFSVIVLELFMLLNRHAGKRDFLDRMSSLKQYQSRNLTGIAAEQAGLFIQMLDILVANDFNAKKSKRDGETIFAELRGNIRKNGLHGQEVMPHDWVWEDLLRHAAGYRIPVNPAAQLPEESDTPPAVSSARRARGRARTSARRASRVHSG